MQQKTCQSRVFFRALNECAAIRNKNHAEHAEHDVRVLVPQQLLLQGSKLQQIKNITFDEIATSNAKIGNLQRCSAAPLHRRHRELDGANNFSSS